MKSKQLAAAVAALLASSTAAAGSLTGNIGVVSNYMFRGIDQSSQGAAVQGGVDYGFDFGAYLGLWVTNASLANGNEADVYAGYGVKLGEFHLDAGIIYYAYTEDTEPAGPGAPGGANLDYPEVYVGGAVGPVALKVFYANEFGGDTGAGSPTTGSGDPDKNDLLYATASVALALTDTLSFTPQVGFSSGDGVKDAFGDEYLDYSLTATKRLKDDMSVSLAVVGTDLEVPTGVTPDDTDKDNPKFVIGFKKGFDI